MDTPPTAPIFTDELHSPGYVWLRCDRYQLPDNTASRIGYYCAYRPLAVHANGHPLYAGNADISDMMRADIRAYYAAQAAQAAATHTADAQADA